MVLTAPPPGVVGVGGCRFLLHELQDLVSAIEDGGGRLVAMPDTLTGQRLVGTAADRDAVRTALGKLGASALLIDAFREPSADEQRQSA
jgi:hypothetical protein